MSGGTISSSADKIEALKLQSSAYGVTIPWVMGVTRIPGNLVWYGGFLATPVTETQGGKGGVNVQSTSFLYTASVVMGLCHGPITGLPRIWRGKKLYTGEETPGLIKTAIESFTPTVGAMSYTVAHASAWLTCLRVTQVVTYDNGEASTTTGPQEIAPDLQYTARAGVITAVDGGLSGVPLTITYQWYDGSIVHNALTDLGLTFLSGEVGQPVWSGLATAPAPEQLAYSGLACVAGADYSLGTGAQVENHNFEVIGPGAYSLGSTLPDVDPSAAARELLSNGRFGAGFPAAQLAPWPAWSDFCVATGILISPAITEQVPAAEALTQMAELTNSVPVWSGGLLRMIPRADANATGNGRTFTANITPVYDLDDECFVPALGEPPVQVTMKTPADRYNHVRVEYLNRANNYAVEIAEAKDQAEIDMFGQRTMPIISAHWICDAAAAGQVAQLRLQRALAVAADYAWQLPAHFALLEPGDLVTLTETATQYSMARVPVRITSIEEGEAGDLAVKAEHCPLGMANAPIYDLQTGDGYSANYNAVPLSVQAPLFFEPPWELAGSTGLAVWIAVTGQATDANWGGCNIWVSSDGSQYQRLGQVNAGSRYGTLRSAITDTATSLPVQLVGLGGQIISGSAADADSGATLLYLDGSVGEYMTHTTAALVGAKQYDLTVQRATNGTTAAAAASGTAWARVDSAVWHSDALLPALIGKTFHVKFTSFNVFGLGEQALSDATAYTYTIKGAQYALKPVGAGGGFIVLESTAALFQFADGTTHTSVSPAITFTARLMGLVGTVTWSATAYNAMTGGSAIGAVTMTTNGNAATMTAAQFVAPGTLGSVRRVEVTASLNGQSDSLPVFRYDPTVSNALLWLSNAQAVVPTDEAGELGDYSGATTYAAVYKGNGTVIQDLTSSHTWTITPDSGVTATINGGAGPVSGAASILIAVSGMTIDDGAVLVTATPGTGPALSATFRVVKSKADGTGWNAYWDPSSLTLPVGDDGNVSSFNGAVSDFHVVNAVNQLDDTANWSKSITTRNVTATLVGARATITAWLPLGQVTTGTTIPATLHASWTRAGQLIYTPGGNWLNIGFNNATTWTAFRRTTNYGASPWTDITVPAGSWNFGDASDTAVLVFEVTGSSNRYLRSVDDGATWTSETLPTGAQRKDAIWTGAEWLVSSQSSTVGYRSATGATGSWSAVTMPGSACVLSGGAGVVLATTGAGTQFYSRDGGVTWLSMADGYSGAAAFRGRLYTVLSADPTKMLVWDGARWIKQALPSTAAGFTGLLVIGDILYLIASGSIKYTTDGLAWKAGGSGVSTLSAAVRSGSRALQVDFIPTTDLTPAASNYAKWTLLTATSDTLGSVTMLATKPDEEDIRRVLPVYKGQAARVLYVASADPAILMLPATSDGVVTSYAGATVTGKITADGQDVTSLYSISWSTANLSPSSGTGAVVTVTNMPQAATEGTIVWQAVRAGYPVVTGTTFVRKTLGTEPSGPRVGRTFAAITTSATYIGLRIGSDGRWYTKVGSGGSWVAQDTWGVGISPTAFWLYVTVPPEGAFTSGTTGTWLAMTSDRDYILSDATPGTHTRTFDVLFSTSSTGANAGLCFGRLTLIVP